MAMNSASRDFSVEYTSVSGVLYVIVDRKLLHTQKFDEHVKLQIFFNKDIDGRQIAFDRDGFERPADDRVEIDEIKLEQETLPAVAEHSKDVELSGENDTSSTLPVDPDNASDTDVMSLQEQDDDDYEPVKRKKTKRVSRKPVPKKKKSPKASGSAKRVASVKRVSKESLREERKSAGISRIKKAKEIIGTRKRKKRIRPSKIDKEQDMYCPYCCTMFKSRREYRSHYWVDRKKHHCVKCNKVLLSEAHLMIHMDEHENEASGEAVEKLDLDDSGQESFKPKKCPVCKLVCSSISCLKLHVMTHTGENEFKCCVCGQLSRSSSRLLDHMRSRHADKKLGQVTCKICNITFPSRAELATHRSTHKFVCNLCGKEFPNQPTLNCHCRMYHDHDGLKCHLCDKIYSSKEALEAHVEYHNRQKKTQCPTCGGFYVRLKRHIEYKHAPEATMFVCDKCPKQFKTKMCLDAHIRGVHSDKKPYECPECSKSFTRGNELKVHMRLHLQDKPFVCDICGKACKSMGNLRSHMRTHQRPGADLAPTTTHSHSSYKQHLWLPSFPPHQTLWPAGGNFIPQPIMSVNDPPAGFPGTQ